MLGVTKIYFGKVVDVQDTEKLFRCKVSIDGLTNEIEKDLLPWYYPWYGLNYLPLENDVVPVIIFDENVVTGFYGRNVELNKSELSDDDYKFYLEIYKRIIADKTVELSYTKTDGIQFINGDSKIKIEIDKTTFFVESNSISISKDKIYIGNENQEASMLGDKSVTHLHNIIKHQKAVIDNCMTMFNAIASACVSPHTAPIKAALTPMVSSYKPVLLSENSKVDSEADTIQSKKTFIE